MYFKLNACRSTLRRKVMVDTDGRCISSARDPPGQRSVYICPGIPNFFEVPAMNAAAACQADSPIYKSMCSSAYTCSFRASVSNLGDEERETYRVMTFLQFPPQSPVHPCQLATAGFLFTGYKDRARCFRLVQKFRCSHSQFSRSTRFRSSHVF